MIQFDYLFRLHLSGGILYEYLPMGQGNIKYGIQKKVVGPEDNYKLPRFNLSMEKYFED